VAEVKKKVRSLCLQNQPNESLLLLLLDDLSRASASMGDDNYVMYDELARQARHNQGKVVLSSFALSVLGEGANDAVSKALAKCLKSKIPRIETDGDGKEELKRKESKSPLEALYPPVNHGVMPPFQQQAGQYPMYGAPTGYGYGGYRPYRSSRGRGYNSGYSRTPSGCFLCGSNDHWLRDCEKLKEMKQKM
jgi:hypothetical protein